MIWNGRQRHISQVNPIFSKLPSRQRNFSPRDCIEILENKKRGNFILEREISPLENRNCIEILENKREEILLLHAKPNLIYILVISERRARVRIVGRQLRTRQRVSRSSAGQPRDGRGKRKTRERERERASTCVTAMRCALCNEPATRSFLASPNATAFPLGRDRFRSPTSHPLSL